MLVIEGTPAVMGAQKFPFLVVSSEQTSMKVGKTQEGGVELCFQKPFFLTKQRLFSRSDSDRVQSLIEFRVLVQQIESKNAENKRRTQAIYTGSFNNPEVVLSPLHFQGDFH